MVYYHRDKGTYVGGTFIGEFLDEVFLNVPYILLMIYIWVVYSEVCCNAFKTKPDIGPPKLKHKICVIIGNE